MHKTAMIFALLCGIATTALAFRVVKKPGDHTLVSRSKSGSSNTNELTFGEQVDDDEDVTSAKGQYHLADLALEDASEHPIFVSNTIGDRDGSAAASARGGRRRSRRRDSRSRDSRRRDRRRDGGGGDPSPPRRRGPPAVGGSCHEFLLHGDYGYRNSQAKRVAKGMARVAKDVKPTAIFALGDNVYYAQKEKNANLETSWYDIFPRDHESLRVPWYPVTGNHDWESDLRETQIGWSKSSKNVGGWWQWDDLWYKKSFATSEGTTMDFFMVDSYTFRGEKNATRWGIGDAPERHRAWLDDELKKSGADWKIVVTHHPVYLWTPKGGLSRSKQKGLADAIENNRVPIVVTGHFHHLGAVIGREGTRAVISGGGGKAKGGKKDGSPNCERPTGNSLAYCEGGGFYGLKVCDKNEALLTMYDENGDTVTSHRTPNGRDMRSLTGEPIPSQKEVSMKSETFIPYETGSDLVQCNGAEIQGANLVCARDGCTLAHDGQMTCDEFCAMNKLACVGAWVQDQEDSKCDVSDVIRCDESVDDAYTICQCD